MGEVRKDYRELYSDCDHFLYNMCKMRTKELRDCVMPRCCGICHKVDYCEGVCTPLRQGVKNVQEDV